jgi:hypothetical protein
MNPIVDGIAGQYEGRVDVRRLNAAREGRAAFEAYRLPGHPAYVLLRPGGARVWSDVGIQPAEAITRQLDALLP